MLDLFGNEVEEQDEYKRYLSSAKWAAKREVKLKSAHYNCERCGSSKYSKRLEVHHLTYERLGQERMEDLEVLCWECHAQADAERVQADQDARDEKKLAGSLVQGFINFLAHKYLEISKISDGRACSEKREFLKMLYKKTGRSYSLDLNLLDIEDNNPEWTP